MVLKRLSIEPAIIAPAIHRQANVRRVRAQRLGAILNVQSSERIARLARTTLDTLFSPRRTLTPFTSHR